MTTKKQKNREFERIKKWKLKNAKKRNEIWNTIRNEDSMKIKEMRNELKIKRKLNKKEINRNEN